MLHGLLHLGMRIRGPEPRGKRRRLHAWDQSEKGTRGAARGDARLAEAPEHEQGRARGLGKVPLEHLHQGGRTNGGVSPRDEPGGLLARHAAASQLSRVLIRRRSAAGLGSRVGTVIWRSSWSWPPSASNQRDGFVGELWHQHGAEELGRTLRECRIDDLCNETASSALNGFLDRTRERLEGELIRL